MSKTPKSPSPWEQHMQKCWPLGIRYPCIAWFCVCAAAALFPGDRRWCVCFIFKWAMSLQIKSPMVVLLQISFECLTHEMEPALSLNVHLDVACTTRTLATFFLECGPWVVQWGSGPGKYAWNCSLVHPWDIINLESAYGWKAWLCLEPVYNIVWKAITIAHTILEVALLHLALALKYLKPLRGRKPWLPNSGCSGRFSHPGTEWLMFVCGRKIPLLGNRSLIDLKPKLPGEANHFFVLFF